MEKIKIGGELYSIAKDGIVINTEGIMDDGLNSTQSSLNQKFHDDINSIKTRIPYSCETTSDAISETKIVSIDNFTTNNLKPIDGTLIMVDFKNGNTCRTAVSLNINNCGSIPVMFRGASLDLIIKNNTVVTMIYSELSNVWNVLTNLDSSLLYWDDGIQ